MARRSDAKKNEWEAGLRQAMSVEQKLKIKEKEKEKEKQIDDLELDDRPFLEGER